VKFRLHCEYDDVIKEWAAWFGPADAPVCGNGYGRTKQAAVREAAENWRTIVTYWHAPLPAPNPDAVMAFLQ